MKLQLENGLILIQGIDFEFTDESTRIKGDDCIFNIKILSDKAQNYFNGLS